MCLSIPVQVAKIIDKRKVIIKSKNREFEIDASLLLGLRKDDWILVQGRLAVKKIDKNSVANIFDLFNNENIYG